MLCSHHKPEDAGSAHVVCPPYAIRAVAVVYQKVLPLIMHDGRLLWCTEISEHTLRSSPWCLLT